MLAQQPRKKKLLEYMIEKQSLQMVLKLRPTSRTLREK